MGIWGGEKCLLGHVQIYADFFINFQLHDDKRISSLTLAQRWIQAKRDECVRLVILREDEEFFDGLVLDFVVVCLAS